MNLILADSFDHYVTADIAKKWTAANSGAISAGTGRGSPATASMRLAGSVNGPAIATANLTTVYIGFAWKAQTANAVAMLRLFDAAAIQLDLAKNASGFMTIRRGGGADTVVATTGALSTGSYYHIESRFTLSATVGIVEVRVNGVAVINSTGLNIITSANPYTNSIMMLSGGGGGNYDFDDFTVTTDAFCGDCRVVAVLPQGAGNYSQWTPSAGLGYQCVDEATMNSDTDYVSSATAGQRNSYDFAALGSSGVIKAVQHVSAVRKDDAGSRTIKQFARIAGTDYDSSAISVADTYVMQRRVMSVSPATSTDWTVSELDAAEFGVKLES